MRNSKKKTKNKLFVIYFSIVNKMSTFVPARFGALVLYCTCQDYTFFLSFCVNTRYRDLYMDGR